MAETRQKPNAQAEEYMRIQDLFYLCISRWKWFVLSLFITLSVATVYILRTPPVYTRSSAILIKEGSKGRSMSSDYGNFADMGFLRNQTNINNELLALRSPAVMLEVIKRLNLDMNYFVPGNFYKKVAYGTKLPVNVTIEGLPEYVTVGFTMKIFKDGKVKLFDFSKEEDADKEVEGKLSDTIQTPIGKLVVAPSPHYVANKDYLIYVVRNALYRAVNAYSANFSVSLNDENTSILRLSMKDVSTQRAEDILNTLITVYNENWIKDKNQIAVSTSQFINERLAVIEAELGDVDEDISSYKSEHLLPNVEAASSMYMAQSNQANAEIMALNNQMYMSRYIRNYLTSEANKNQLLPANSGIDNNNIERLISEYNAQLLQRNSLVANSSDANPLVVDMDKTLVELRQAIMGSIDNQMTAIENQLNSLQQKVQQTTERIAANPTQAKYLLSVERQQKVKESLYLYLLQKREENELSQAFTAYNTRVITPPHGSGRPTYPMTKNILMVAFVLGVMVPLIIIFLKESLNTKIRGRKDLDNVAIPYLGEIPLYVQKKKGLFAKKQRRAKNAVVVKEGRRDIINEAFRVLRTNLEFMTEKSENANVILITSFNPGSGKSFLSLNIAVSLAIKNKKVLIIDGDFRHASTSSYIDSPAIGLSDFLNGREDNLENIIVVDNKYTHLHFLPVGTIPPNPTELLFDERMKYVIDEVRKEYDYVFIDCPPVEMVADTQILEKLADRSIFVVRAGLFERSMLAELEQLYIEKKYKNMAMILNGTEGNGGKYGYKYGYRYGYQYGYGYGYHYGSNKS